MGRAAHLVGRAAVRRTALEPSCQPRRRVPPRHLPAGGWPDAVRRGRAADRTRRPRLGPDALLRPLRRSRRARARRPRAVRVARDDGQRDRRQGAAVSTEDSGDPLPAPARAAAVARSPASEEALADAAAQAARYASLGQAPNTRRAYAADRRDYERWCAAHALVAYPASPAQLGVYLAHLAAARRPS